MTLRVAVPVDSFGLPLGPGQLLFKQSSGTLARIFERWETSWILNVGSGAPANISAANMLYANGVPDIVGAFDSKAANVQWTDGEIAGNYFGRAYTKVRDPQCTAIAASLGRCLVSSTLLVLNALTCCSGLLTLFLKGMQACRLRMESCSP